MWSAKNLHTRGNSGKQRSTHESLTVTLCRSAHRTTYHFSPQRLTKISRNRHAKHAPRPRQPKLRVVESRSPCGFLASLGMSIVFQIDEGGERDLNSVRPAVNKQWCGILRTANWVCP